MEITNVLSLLFLVTFSHSHPLSKRDQAYPGRCINVYTECPEWKKNGLCEQNREYMTTTCPVTCGFCEEEKLEENQGYDEKENFDVEESGSASEVRDDISSGNVAQTNKEEPQEQVAKPSSQEGDKYRQKATEEERTENAEKYEDEEKDNKGKGKPVQERSNKNKPDLMERVLANGKLQAISVTKGKARHGVPADDSEQANEGDEDDSTDIDLDLKETGLDAFSGSGESDDKLHLTLRQTYNKNYDDKNSPAYSILSGNFEKDMLAALEGENKVSDIDFTEAEVEGNPKTTGKVQVNFKFSGNYEKLNKVIKSGNINGLLVVKNSLEGPMLDLNTKE